MNKVVFDTNILLDIFEAPRPSHAISSTLATALLTAGVEIQVVATSLKDLYYILARRLDKDAAQKAIQAVMATMTLLPVNNSCCQAAAASSEPDFEDGIIRAAAETAHADFIVTRDRSAFVASPVATIEPADLLLEIQSQIRQTSSSSSDVS